MAGGSGGAEAEEEEIGSVSLSSCLPRDKPLYPTQTSCHDALRQHTPALRRGELRGHGDGEP